LVKKINVLIYPAGAENAIDIYDSLKYNIHFNIYGASGKSDHTEFIYPHDRYVVSNDLYISKINFIDILNTILKRFEIVYIIPTHDVIAAFLTENSDKITAKIVCSPYETAKVAVNKYLSYKFFKDYDFVTEVYQNVEEIKEYPVFVKPFVGAGGKGTFKADSKLKLTQMLETSTDFLISEYLSGDEYTVDCFTNYKGELLFIGPRTRERITMGITFHSERVEINPEIVHIAQTINKSLCLRGAWFFQLKKDKVGKLKLMEFSVRQAGTMAFYRQLGINFAALSLFDAMGLEVKILFNDYLIKLDRCIKSCYQLKYFYDYVYVDLDDTLIVNDKVNTTLMRFLYQCINNKIKIILITKHAYDVSNTLVTYRISKELFDEIIIISSDEDKSKYIRNYNSIFIDNYYFDRAGVKEVCNIPVFDVDAIECLINTAEL
jgi:hypothetical protein